MNLSRMRINLRYRKLKFAYVQGRSDSARLATPHVRATPGAGLAPAEGRTMQRNGIHHVTAIAGPARRNIEF
jgi:hypothetical protein